MRQVKGIDPLELFIRFEDDLIKFGFWWSSSDVSVVIQIIICWYLIILVSTWGEDLVRSSCSFGIE